MKIISIFMGVVFATLFFATKIVGLMIFAFSAATMFLLTNSVALSIFAGAMSVIGVGLAFVFDGLASGYLKVPVIKMEE